MIGAKRELVFGKKAAPSSTRPKAIVISHVVPFPGKTGQQQRVRYLLESILSFFDVDFLSYAPRESARETHERLARFGCRPIVMEARANRSSPARLVNEIKIAVFMLRTGLKRSNYTIGKIELSPVRIGEAIDPRDYNLAIYEYFHSVDSLDLFRSAGVPTVLDTHNVLWRSLEQQMSAKRFPLGRLDRYRLARYREREEAAWRKFDGVVAINRCEEREIQSRLLSSQKLFYAPMGADLSRWPYRWSPSHPPRIAYYGGLGSPHNEAAAIRCHDKIMPGIWREFPNAELWLVGSNPSERLRSLAVNPRVKVTGFVENAQDVLATMSLILCPWAGTYGFRSRLVEVMALGVPVVATASSVDGMELESGKGLQFAETNEEFTAEALLLLRNSNHALDQSRLARSETERLYSLGSTYGRLAADLSAWIEARKPR